MAAHHGGEQKEPKTISSLHHDIIQSHIFTRLDGPTLAAAACSSSEFRSLSTQDNLWENICSSTWPSINDPRVSSAISSFPSGHRSFFSDSYPLLHHDRHQHRRAPLPGTEELISAVDIYYKGKSIFSKVAETETLTSWFMCSPFRVDLLEPKEVIPAWILPEEDAFESEEKRTSHIQVKEVEENMRLSWILIDPKRKRAVNLSSGKAVTVERHWLTGEVVVKFAAVMAGERRGGGEKEWVECGMAVTCGEKRRGSGGGGRGEGEVEVREVFLAMEDMEGKCLMGKDSLVILQGAMEGGVRRKTSEGRNEGKERFLEFVKKKKERQERKVQREKVLDLICITTGVLSFVAFWITMLLNLKWYSLRF